MSNIKLTDKLIADSLTHGSRFKSAKPAWMTRSEVIEAIKFSHGVTEISQENTPSKTDEIMEFTAPVHNPYQGITRKVLFVCQAGMLRSPTAMALACARGMNARACGTHNKALIPMSVNLIQWANQIVYLDRDVEKKAMDKFRGIEGVYTKSICWDIPDQFDYYEQRLVDLIKPKLDELEKVAIYARPRA
jgi:predicted protein tyrosine phosphatase